MSEVSNILKSSTVQTPLSSSIPTSTTLHQQRQQQQQHQTPKTLVQQRQIQQPSSNNTITPLRQQQSLKNNNSNLLQLSQQQQQSPPTKSKANSLFKTLATTRGGGGMATTKITQKNDHPTTADLLHVETASISTATVSSSSSLSTTSSSVKSKTSVEAAEVAKLSKEVTRLEALCESRTKELGSLKCELRNALTAFDAMSKAFDYVANTAQGFHAQSLRSQLSRQKLEYDKQLCGLRLDVECKERSLMEAQASAQRSLSELEAKLATTVDEYQIQIGLARAEHELVVDDLKRCNELAVRKLAQTLDELRAEKEKLVGEMTDQVAQGVAENAELARRLAECEDALAAKDKDERVVKLLEGQKHLEREVESLNAAIDIKNRDLNELRARNNELTTRVESFGEVSMAMRRYKQEVEQLSAIVMNKQEAERRASEHARLLAVRVEAKNKENQRLSMHNEQLQFRLQQNTSLMLGLGASDHDSSGDGKF
jgi:hypothetical protein